MILLGLTGSIGMGKSTTAALFAKCGDAVIDADAIVHDLYRGRAVAPLESAFPGVVAEGVVDRAKLGAAVVGDAAAFARLEAIVHPLVREEQEALRERAEAAGRRFVVMDVPLLFETGREHEMNAILVVTAPDAVQRARVLARPQMTEEKFAAIKAKQMPDDEKRKRAHFVMDTTGGLEAAAADVCAIRRAVLSMS